MLVYKCVTAVLEAPIFALRVPASSYTDDTEACVDGGADCCGAADYSDVTRRGIRFYNTLSCSFLG